MLQLYGCYDNILVISEQSSAHLKGKICYYA